MDDVSSSAYRTHADKIVQNYQRYDHKHIAIYCSLTTIGECHRQRLLPFSPISPPPHRKLPPDPPGPLVLSPTHHHPYHNHCLYRHSVNVIVIVLTVIVCLTVIVSLSLTLPSSILSRLFCFIVVVIVFPPFSVQRLGFGRGGRCALASSVVIVFVLICSSSLSLITLSHIVNIIVVVFVIC